MRILILGGTQFLGRHFVDAVQARGWELTLFNRGQTNPAIYTELEQLRGDRDPNIEPGLAALEGRSWDIIVDPSGYVPRLVNASLAALASSGYYCFISSISVYSDFASPGQDESAPLDEIDDPTTEEWAGPAYGPLKALCEDAVRDARPDSHLNVRAGLIIGPHDPTERYTYWVRRVARGGEVLAPVGPDYPIQAIHAGDIAEWSLEMAAGQRSGTFNVTSAIYPLGELLEAAKRETGSDARFTYVSEEFLLEQEVGAWMELPLWMPTPMAGLMQTSVAAAQGVGLQERPLAQTIRETLAWAQETPPVSADVGLTPEREAELLAAWAAR